MTICESNSLTFRDKTNDISGKGIKGKFEALSHNWGGSITGYFSGKNGSAGVDASLAEVEVIKKINEEFSKGVKPVDALANAGGKLKDRLEELVKNSDGVQMSIVEAGKGAKVGATGFQLLKLQVASTMTAMKAMAKSFLIWFAVMEIINLVIKGIKWMFDTAPTKNHIREWAEEARTALEDTRKEVDSVTSELETMRDRIAELEGMGNLTLTEQSELDQLKQQNAELSKKLAILKAIEAEQSREASRKSFAAAESYGKSEVKYSAATGRGGEVVAPNVESDAMYKDLERYVELYKEAQEEIDKLSPSSEKDRKKFEELTKEAEGYKSFIVELSQGVSKELEGVNRDNLSADQLQKYDQMINEIQSSLINVGVLNMGDILSSALSSKELQALSANMQDLADSQKEINENSITEAIGQDAVNLLNQYGISIEQLVENVEALRGISGTVDNVSKSDKFKDQDINGKISAITSDKDFNIDITSATSALGKDFVKACEEAGVSAEELVEWLKSVQKQSEKTSLSGMVEEFADFEEKIQTVVGAIDEFKENSGNVSASSIKDVADAFESMSGTKEFENMIKVLSNSASSIEEVESSMSNLVNAYLQSSNVMADLNEGTKELYINRLKAQGIANAEVVVEYQLAKAKYMSADASDAQRAAALEEMQAIILNTGALDRNAAAALSAAEMTSLFAGYQQLAAGNNFASVVSNHAVALGKVASAAGPAAANLKKYVDIVSEIASIKGMLSGKKLDNRVKTRLNSRLKGLSKTLDRYAEEAEKEFNNLFVADISFSSGGVAGSGGSGGSGGSKGTSASDKRKNKYDSAKEKLDHKLNMNYISYATYYKRLEKLGKKYLKGQKGNAADYRKHLEELADVRKAAFDKEEAQNDKKYAKGQISLRTYHKRTLASIKKWLKTSKANQEDYAEAMDALQKKISDAWGDRINKQQQQIDRFGITGWITPGKSEADYWRDQLALLIEDQGKGLFTDTDAFLDLYYEILEKIKNAEAELADNELDKIEKKIGNVDDLVDMVSNMLKQRLEDQIDALEEQIDKYNEIVDLKKKSLDITRDELDYQRELKEQNEELTKLQAKAAVLALDTSREGKAKYAALMEEIRAKQQDISDKQSDHAYDGTVDALDEATEKYEKEMQKQIDDLNAKMENNGEWLQGVYDYIQYTDPSALLDELLAYNYKYGDGLNSTVEDMWERTEPLLQSYQYDIRTIIDELRRLKLEQEKQIEEAKSNKNDKFADLTLEQTKEAVSARNTRTNSDADNLALLARIKQGKWNGGKAWYDSETNLIWMGDHGEKKMTASAYWLIKDMKAINNDTSKTKAQKQKELDPLLEELHGYYGYPNAHLDWNKTTKKFELHRKKGTAAAYKVFHSGLGGGFVGDTYMPTKKQSETYALLKNDELVLNKNDQDRIGLQLQTLSMLTESIKGILPTNSVSNNNQSTGIEINIPINIDGNATGDTVRALRSASNQIANETLSKVTEAMNQRGYNSRVGSNAMRR
ncbi:DNA repair exonuclease SbcCD ATPase subunit/transposase-like protein [Clostridiales Family XIII bacterium PM5-7]